MSLYGSVKMMGIWVTAFLLACLQVKKKYLAWEKHTVRVKLHNVLAAKLSQEAELSAFPQPLVLTLGQEFAAHELHFRANSLRSYDGSQTIVVIRIKNNPS